MYTQRLASLALAVAASFIWTYAEAGCVDLWTRGLSDAQGIRRSEFRPGEQFVVCFRFPDGSFVSLWDVPPRGDASRLFPNLLTHRENNATIRAAQLSGSQEHCSALALRLHQAGKEAEALKQASMSSSLPPSSSGCYNRRNKEQRTKETPPQRRCECVV